MEDKLEQPEETCGLMVTLEGGIGITVNLKATRQRVIEKIQTHLAKGLANLVELETANPDEEEVFLLDPKKILSVLVKKEFMISSGKIVSARMGSPGVPPQKFEH